MPRVLFPLRVRVRVLVLSFARGLTQLQTQLSKKFGKLALFDSISVRGKNYPLTSPPWDQMIVGETYKVIGPLVPHSIFFYCPGSFALAFALA
jgi:hypothetical protein